MFGLALVVHHHRRLLGERRRASARSPRSTRSIALPRAPRNTRLRRPPANPKETPMAQSLSPAAQNSTNVRFMFETLARRIGLRTSALLAPGFAGMWAERLFLTPPKPRYPNAEVFDLLEARQSFVQHRGRHIATWRWGPSDAPAVLLAHGWGGRATQMRRFVPPLLAAGFRVIAYDQPAHGLSDGRLTGLPDFADVLAEWRATMARCARSSATRSAVPRPPSPSRAGCPSSASSSSARPRTWWATRGASRAGSPFPSACAARCRRRSRSASACAGPILSSRASRRGCAPQALVIHDRADAMVPWRQGAAVARHWPGARLMSTHGLGHGRILEDDTVARAAADFIAGRSAVAGPAVPALPNPAPLY
jgi:pimeloyl-ACP methyl ester carboxylesterase